MECTAPVTSGQIKYPDIGIFWLDFMRIDIQEFRQYS